MIKKLNICLKCFINNIFHRAIIIPNSFRTNYIGIKRGIV